MRLIAVVIVLLPGCIFGECGYSPSQAEWTDAAMWGALDAPIQSPAGIDSGDERLRLRYVTVETGLNTRAMLDIFLWQDGVVSASVGDGQRAAVEAAAGVFFENATENAAPWVEQFMASESREDVGRNLNGDPDEHLWILRYALPFTLNGTAFLEKAGIDPAHQGGRSGAIFVGFQATYKEVALDGIRLRVDAFGDVTAEKRWREGTSDEEAIAEVRRALRDHALPDPDGMLVSGVVC